MITAAIRKRRTGQTIPSQVKSTRHLGKRIQVREEGTFFLFFSFFFPFFFFFIPALILFPVALFLMKNQYEDENLFLLSQLGLYEDPEEKKLREEEERRKEERRLERERKRAEKAKDAPGPLRSSARLSGQTYDFAELGPNEGGDEDEWDSYSDEDGHHSSSARLVRRRQSGRRDASGWGFGGVELYKGRDRERYYEHHLKALGTCIEPYPHFGEERIYDQTNGSTCHQCRQKIIGQKSKCSECNTMSGWFCGECLQKRYGENLLEVVEKKDWRCPSCRGFCNCSICRNRLGYGPTGALAPTARREGYPSAAHYLVYKNYVDPKTGLKTPLNPDGTPIPGAGESPRKARNGRYADQEEDDFDEMEEESVEAGRKRRRGKAKGSDKDDIGDDGEEGEEGGRAKLSKSPLPVSADPHTRPKAVRSAYQIFTSERSKAIKAQNPTMRFGDIGRQVGAEWKALSKEEKQVFRDRSSAERRAQEEAMSALIKVQQETHKRQKRARNRSDLVAPDAAGKDDLLPQEEVVASRKRGRTGRVGQSDKQVEKEPVTPKTLGKKKTTTRGRQGDGDSDADRTPKPGRTRVAAVEDRSASSEGEVVVKKVPGFDIINLGVLEPDLEAFASPELLVPNGYEVIYHSSRFKGSRNSEHFRCRISCDESNRPVYSVSLQGGKNVAVGSTPTDAWRNFLKYHHLSPDQWEKVAKGGFDGAVLFGLEDANIKKLLEKLPNADRMTSYRMDSTKVRWTLSQGDVIAVRTPLEDDERFWLAEITEPKPVNVLWRGNKGSVSIRWFQSLKPGSKIYRFSEPDSVVIGSIFHAKFNEDMRVHGPTRFMLTADIAHYDI